MILVDLEGVLTDHTDRLALLLSRTQDNKRDRTAWKDYYKAIMEDQPRMHILDMVHDWSHHHSLLLGRVSFQGSLPTSNRIGIKNVSETTPQRHPRIGGT